MYGDFTFVNNVLFNYRHRTVDGGDHMSFFNIINNYYKPGPGTPNNDVAYRLLKPESERSKTVKDHFGKAYVNGNVVEGYEKVTKNNWDGGVQPDVKTEPLTNALAKIRVDEPFKHAPLEIQSAKDAYDYVLANVGATLPHRDPVDERIIKEVRTGVIPPMTIAKGSQEKAQFYGYAQKWTDELAEYVTKGFVTDPSEVGGWPDYKGEPVKDLCADGIPLSWKKKFHLDTNDVELSQKDLQGDGYTVIEKFLYDLDPTKKFDRAALQANVNPTK
jgi:hypothetical protein